MLRMVGSWLAALALVVSVAIGKSALAQPTFSVEGTGTSLTRLSLALVPGDGMSRPSMLQIARPMQQALLSSGFFSIGILPPNVSNAPQNWQSGGSAYLVTLQVSSLSVNRRAVAIEVTDGSFGGERFTRQLEIEGGELFDIGSAAADVVYQYFLDREGYFTSRIVYVRDAHSGGRRSFEIVSSDLFGNDARVLVTSRSELLSPKVSPDGAHLVWVGIRGDRPHLFWKSMSGGSARRIFNDKLIRFSPTFDSAGNLYYTKIIKGNSDIYRTSLSSRRERRLTSNPSIETAPSVSSTANSLLYISDSSGRQRVVRQGLDGGGRQFVGQQRGAYGSPAWAPDGQSIAFTRQSQGQFSIGTFDPATGEEKQLSTSFFEEHPIWANNSKVIIFERAARGGGSGLWQVDAETSHLQRLPIQGNARDPSWLN